MGGGMWMEAGGGGEREGGHVAEELYRSHGAVVVSMWVDTRYRWHASRQTVPEPVNGFLVYATDCGGNVWVRNGCSCK